MRHRHPSSDVNDEPDPDEDLTEVELQQLWAEATPVELTEAAPANPKRPR